MPIAERVNTGPTLRLSKQRSQADARPDPESTWDDGYRWDWIAENAYYRSERRGFLPGYEVEDWLAAELELEQSRQSSRSPDS
jgi:Protein of unknown function (DUF2934)